MIDLEFSKWETISGNCNECKNTEKENCNRIDFIVLVIQLNLYIFLNGASKKIIDNRINAVPTSIVTINKKSTR